MNTKCANRVLLTPGTSPHTDYNYKGRGWKQKLAMPQTSLIVWFIYYVEVGENEVLEGFIT